MNLLTVEKYRKNFWQIAGEGSVWRICGKSDLCEQRAAASTFLCRRPLHQAQCGIALARLVASHDDYVALDMKHIQPLVQHDVRLTTGHWSWSRCSTR